VLANLLQFTEVVETFWKRLQSRMPAADY